ncbi:P-loop containing nucleoside triphosphate hydrolase protein [Pavlovales sp. CCMP2436]|nr:P-loop containing nucleoside triphosphate hydrolase protein [Pavlovales sp. CCMP2436]
MAEGGLAAISLPARPEDGSLGLRSVSEGKAGLFSFDRVYGPAVATAELYDEGVAPVVKSFCDGFSVCVFAYGQTGSGKTHTMQGTQQQPGVNVLALRVKRMILMRMTKKM